MLDGLGEEVQPLGLAVHPGSRIEVEVKLNLPHFQSLTQNDKGYISFGLFGLFLFFVIKYNTYLL